MPDTKRLLLFVGSYAEASGDGVYVYDVDPQSGALTRLSAVGGLTNPTFLNVDPARRVLYTFTAVPDEGQGGGATVCDAVAYTIDVTAGRLTELNRARALNGPACHIQRRSDGRYLTLASYHAGSVSLVALGEGGRVGRLLDVQSHAGRNPHRRPGEDVPHVHSSFYSPDERFLFVCDLGLDVVRRYRVDEAGATPCPDGDTPLPPGAGPRHMVFHPNGKFAYVIAELSSSITAFAYVAEEGTLHALETISTLPTGVDVANACAEIALSTDGRFLYGSNRGHDSIVVYAIASDTGKLRVVQHVPVGGKHPRHFSLLPCGDFLVVANRDTNNMNVFRVDKQEGTLTFTGHSAELSKPVCVWGCHL